MPLCRRCRKNEAIKGSRICPVCADKLLVLNKEGRLSKRLERYYFLKPLGRPKRVRPPSTGSGKTADALNDHCYLCGATLPRHAKGCSWGPRKEPFMFLAQTTYVPGPRVEYRCKNGHRFKSNLVGEKAFCVYCRTKEVAVVIP